jgi:hypothetical protein
MRSLFWLSVALWWASRIALYGLVFCEEVYARVRNLAIPNMFYRTDIGYRWRRDADLLHAWGYLR